MIDALSCLRWSLSVLWSPRLCNYISYSSASVDSQLLTLTKIVTDLRKFKKKIVTDLRRNLSHKIVTDPVLELFFVKSWLAQEGIYLVKSWLICSADLAKISGGKKRKKISGTFCRILWKFVTELLSKGPKNAHLPFVQEFSLFCFSQIPS